ncbi:LysR family transcriptional regulator [uncultured Sulfitobacter sp.]|uniref:LysR family transcriptional regulator n=1 Tax=Sulfitobacter sp. SH22 TaxID=3421172 RepID=UPI0025D64C33|nr:LysR family transcriptional regulator [uncultured Sulfitobacter sp.]
MTEGTKLPLKAMKGNEMLEDARDLIARSRNWLEGSTTQIGHLQRVSKNVGQEWYFHQQQNPLSDIFDSKAPLLRESLRGWTLAGGYLEHEAMAHVRPYFIVYRPTQAGWISVEFGEESFYVKWFGLTKARSSIGRSIGKMPGGEDFASLIEQPYTEVLHTRSVRLDHISTVVPREEDGELIPISYKRLMMAGRFPDGSFALIAVVQPDRNVNISGIENIDLDDFPQEVNSTFSTNLAKYEQKK